jgi:hypothetical protein
MPDAASKLPQKMWPQTTKAPVFRAAFGEPTTETPYFVTESDADIEVPDAVKRKIMASPKANGIYSRQITQSDGSSSGQCLICYAKASDAIFLDCGHGGLCYDCALDIWKTSNECFLCRQEIFQVLQIDPQALAGNVVKVISCTRIQMANHKQSA